MSSFKIILTVGTIILIGLGWYFISSTNSDQQISPQSAAEIDSLEVSERLVITTQPEADTVDSIAPRAREDLAPGTVLLTGKVVQIDDEQSPTKNVTIEVQEVLGYGASTSPVGTGQTLDVKASKEYRNNPEYQALIEEGKIVTMILSEEGGMNFGETEGQKSWTLIELKPDK